MLSFDISQGANVNIAIVLIMYWSNHTLMHSNFTNTCFERTYKRCWIIISADMVNLNKSLIFFPFTSPEIFSVKRLHGRHPFLLKTTPTCDVKQ